MNKDRIRKYLIAVLATLLTFAAVFAINTATSREAYATTIEVGSITTLSVKDQVDNDLDISKISFTSKVGSEDIAYDASQKKFMLDTSSMEQGTYTITLSAFKYDNHEISHDPVTRDFEVEADKSVNNKAVFETLELVYIDPDKYILISAVPEASTATIPHKSTENELKTALSSEVSKATIKYSNTGSETGVTTAQPTISAWTNYDGTTYHTDNYDQQVVKYKGTISLPTGVVDKNNILDSNPVVTVTVSPADKTLTWNVTITSAVITENGSVSTKGINSVTYQILKEGTAIKTETKPITPAKAANIAVSDSTGMTITGSGTYTLKLTACTIEGNSNSINLSDKNYKVDKTVSSSESTPAITGTIPSITVAATTKPSKYSNLASAEVKNEDDDYIEVSKIDNDLRNAILDYVYDNNVNGLRSVIQSIMAEGKPLSIKVVAKKLDSSDVDSDEKKELKKEAQKPDGAKNADILRYYDISMYITKDGSDNNKAWKITNIGSDNKIKVTLKAKSSSSSSGKRYYMALLYHSGDADNLTDYDTSNSITIKPYKFSTYAMSYYDSSSSSSTATNPASNSAIVPGGGADATAGGGGTDKSKTPKTGDDFNPRIWIYLLIVCATVASAAWILLQDTREDNENKQN